MVYAAREVTKVDARPGGYEVAGGHGRVVADMGGFGPPQITSIPARRHTYCSDVRLSVLPSSVTGVTGSLEGGVTTIGVTTKNAEGELVPTAVPVVTITKYSRYTQFQTGPDEAPQPFGEIEILARIAANLRDAPLAGFVAEGQAPFATTDPTTDAALAVAVFSGMPVVRVGRGNTGGMAYKMQPIFVAGNNLTSTKARMLLMAAIMRFGALPPAVDPQNPTGDESVTTMQAVAQYQQLFDTH